VLLIRGEKEEKIHAADAQLKKEKECDRVALH
jgi:hypothetical protein